ncbi:hypothetical protein [Halomarina oriensis]|uniref:Uncharacterized protein n=1 Tax=Halomarina oriensis TaxID=671145 RepID=A0A6B0GMK9_9EURY|nr:hypothetical protein [Halomarina oriensis]MWG35890.1 hypothetical protein [Halomarina oriensis]
MAVTDSGTPDDGDSGRNKTTQQTGSELEADLRTPIRAHGSVQLGKNNETGTVSMPKDILRSEDIPLDDDASERPEIPVFHHAGRGLLIYDLRGDFSEGR